MNALTLRRGKSIESVISISFYDDPERVKFIFNDLFYC